MHFTQNVAQHAEGDHQHQIEGSAVDSVHTYRGDCRNSGYQKPQRNGQHAGKQTDQWNVHHQQHYVSDQQRCNQPPDDIRLFSEHRRPRGDVVQRQRAHHHRRGTGARHAERQHRDERAAGRGVVGGFWCCYATNIPLAKAVAVAAELFLGHVGDGTGNGGASARQNADEKANH
ncbi:hypothetical protein SDC9_185611 [bioreactor metagenome]|uniref:Uncharacterized protein n=1 Tax=bioreactor metagenome TaxID=1076179 RepID=A0A645HGK5_9ZZZZ